MAVPVWPGMALLRRELRTTLRGRLSFVGLLAVLAGVGCALFVNYPAPSAGLAAIAGFSREMIAMVSVGLALAAFVFLSPLAAISIAGERERDTYTLLHLTLVPPRSMLIAKWFNSLGYFLFLVTGIVPVIGVVFFLVGVDWRLVLTLFAHVFAFAVYCSAAGVCCSAWSHGSTAAVVKTYVVATGIFVLLNFWWQFLELLYLLLVGLGFIWEGGPVVQFMERVHDKIHDGPLQALDRGYGNGSYIVFAWPAIFLAIAFIFFLLALPGIRRFRPRKRKPEAKPEDNFARLVERRKQFPYYLIDPLKRKPPIPDGRNPMFVREIRWGLMGKVSRMVRAFYLALMAQMLIGTITISMSPMNFGNGIMVAFVVDIVLLMFVAPVLTAGALAREVEQGNMDLLRTTLLTPAEILLGKLSSALLSLSPIVAGIAPVLCAFLIPLYLYGENLNSVAYGVVTGLVCLTFSVVVGLFASTIFRRTSFALLLSYGITILAMGVLTIFGVVMSEWAYSYEEGRAWKEIAESLSPLFSYVEVVRYRASYERRELSANMMWYVSMGIYSVLTVSFFLFTLRFFAQKRMRDV